MVAAITAEVVAKMATVAAEDLAFVRHVPSQTSGRILRIAQTDLST